MKINVSGPLEIEGFPVEAAFSVEVQADTLVLRAGAKLFLIVRREAANTAEAVGKLLAAQRKPSQDAESRYVAQEQASLQKTQAAISAVEQELGRTQTPPSWNDPNNSVVSATGAPTGNVETLHSSPRPQQPAGNLIIQLDISKASKYRTNRRKWFDFIATLNGHRVADLFASSESAGLEGDWEKMVQFFIEEKVLQLALPSAASSQPAQTDPQKGSHSIPAHSEQAKIQSTGGFMTPADPAQMFGGMSNPNTNQSSNPLAQLGAQVAFGTPTQGGAAVPGPLWSPPANSGGAKDGPKFP